MVLCGRPKIKTYTPLSHFQSPSFSRRNLKCFFVGGIFCLLEYRQYFGMILAPEGKTQTIVTNDDRI